MRVSLVEHYISFRESGGDPRAYMAMSVGITEDILERLENLYELRKLNRNPDSLLAAYHQIQEEK